MTNKSETFQAMRTAERARRVDALRDGRKQRAVRFTDRKKQAARTACRGAIR